jgi:hypothetical protein
MKGQFFAIFYRVKILTLTPGSEKMSMVRNQKKITLIRHPRIYRFAADGSKLTLLNEEMGCQIFRDTMYQSEENIPNYRSIMVY